MGIKLHRNRRVFRSRRLIPRMIGWITAAAAIIALGFFGAKHFAEHPINLETESDISTNESSYISESIPDSSPEQPTSDPTPIITETDLRAIYLPFSQLTDISALKATLVAATDAGFNSVVFDLKDSNGTLYFRSQSDRAILVNSYADNALTLEQTKAVFTAMRDAGVQPIPRMYTFMDNAAARVLTGARISHQNDPSWVWYDANPSNGGKAWLNPYADEAHLYIIELAKELQSCGACAVMLDGVRFPAQTSSANFGNSANTAKSRDEILTVFIDKVQTLLGTDCPVILSCSADAALGNDTVVYGNNPLTFAPTVAAPTLFTGALKSTLTIGSETVANTPDNLNATIQALMKQMTLRIKVMQSDKQPSLMPWLQAYDYTAAQIKNAMDGCLAGGAKSFILYNPDGIYDFNVLGG